jgi:FMN-dependent dehydrogenase
MTGWCRWGDPFQSWRSPARRSCLAARCPRGKPGPDLGADPDRQRLSPRHRHRESVALGANAVLLGRASLYGLTAAGEAGVDHVLHLLKDEVDRALAQIGCPSVSDFDRLCHGGRIDAYDRATFGSHVRKSILIVRPPARERVRRPGIRVLLVFPEWLAASAAAAHARRATIPPLSQQ